MQNSVMHRQAVNIRPLPLRARGKVGASRGERGFTLLEVIIALALMIMMLAGVSQFYFNTLKARRAGIEVSRDALLANALLRRITDEIRHTCDIVPGDGVGFSGTHDRITIIRTKLPEGYAFDKHDSIADQLPPGQQDIARITYELVWDEEMKDDEGISVCHGLLRSEQRTFDPNPRFVVKTKDESVPPPPDGESAAPGGSNVIPVDRELVAPEIKYVKFEYFDGAEWRDRWQNEQEQKSAADASVDPAELGGGDHALPQAVRVTIGKERVAPEDEELNITQLKKMDERAKKQEYHPDRFTIVIYLEQADQSLLSSRGFSTKNNPDLQTGGE